VRVCVLHCCDTQPAVCWTGIHWTGATGCNPLGAIEVQGLQISVLYTLRVILTYSQGIDRVASLCDIYTVV
jgi:hypothetical protein